MLKYILPLFMMMSVGAEAQTCFAPSCNNTSYIGQVATRSGLSSTDDTTNTGVMSRTLHYARTTFTLPRVGVSGLWLSPTAGEQVDATETFTGAIEYPAGTFYQLKWSGATSVTAGDTLALSDAVAGLTIPDGAAFWVRLYETGTHITYLQLNASLGGYDQTTVGTSTTDQTLSGTVANNNSNESLQPACIVAVTTRAAMLGLGDSRMVGWGDSRSDASADGGEVWHYIGPRYPYIDLSVFGATTQSYLSNNTVRKLLGVYTTAAVDELGGNDVANNNSLTVSQVIGYRMQVNTLFAKPYTFGLTIAPFTTSSDSWKSTVNQSVSQLEPFRTSANASIRAGISGEVQVIDVDRMVDPGATGFWPANGTAYANTIDGNHESNQAAILERNSSLWSVFSIH